MKQEIKSFKKPEWLDMFEKFKDVKYDKIITYDDLDSCLMVGSIRESKRYVFEKFRKELLYQCSKALECIQNKGYRVINPNEHVRVTSQKLKQAERRARLGADVILHVNYEALTEKERSQANLIASRIQNVVAGLIGENKSIKQLSIHYKQPDVPRR